MTRKEELLQIVGDNKLLLPDVDEIIWLEEKLKELYSGGFEKVNPNNPTQKKIDKDKLMEYKALSQIYDSRKRLIARVTDTGESEEESPLRKWAAKYANTE